MLPSTGSSILPCGCTACHAYIQPTQTYMSDRGCLHTHTTLPTCIPLPDTKVRGSQAHRKEPTHSTRYTYDSSPSPLPVPGRIGSCGTCTNRSNNRGCLEIALCQPWTWPRRREGCANLEFLSFFWARLKVYTDF